MVGASVVWLVFIFLSWTLALGWLWQAVVALRGMSRLPDLSRIDPAALPPVPECAGPHLTVVIPACNEEESIQATLRSLLASTGLRLEIIAVDDRSTDRTCALMDEVAAEAEVVNGPHRLRVIHNRELPAGWLGKPHALHLAAQQAVAPWLLFTDADLVFAPRALELAMRQAIASRADHLVLVPNQIRESISEAAMQATIQALVEWSVRLWKVAEPGTRDFFGVGGFNLVRTETYTRLGGFAALRMEVVEDLSFGRMVKRAGFRSCVTVGLGLVNIRWISGAFGIVANVEKNGFAAFRYRLGLSLAACLGVAVQVVLPLAAIAAGGWALPAGLLTYACIALMFHANRRMNGVSPIAAILFAPSAAIAGYGFLRSVVLTLARNGVTWRGTHYPLSELRRNAVPWN
jgi:glycosyltransferase involved in cell wall biosynthesis